MDEERPTIVLVTGATGFIGRRLVDALGERSKVLIRVLTRDAAKARTLWASKTVAVVHADLGAPHTISDACRGVQVLFHLAGHAHAEDEGSRATGVVQERVTVAGTQALLDAAVQAGVRRVVFLSSVKAMSEATSDCADESMEPHPCTAYGQAKLKAERCILEAGKQHRIHIGVLRLPLVYGAGVKGNLLRMMRAIDGGRFPPIAETGNRRSMVHVDDAVQAALLVADKPEANGEIYIATDDQVYSTRQIYSLMCGALGKPVPHWSLPSAALQAGAQLGDLIGWLRGRRFVFDSGALDKLLGSACYSCEKIKRELGYRPTRTFDEAVGEMVAVYRERNI